MAQLFVKAGELQKLVAVLGIAHDDEPAVGRVITLGGHGEEPRPCVGNGWEPSVLLVSPSTISPRM
jgi:hypothetical protein